MHPLSRLKVRLTSQTHEWRRRDDDGTVNIIRAEWDSRDWRFQVTTKKDPEWHEVPEPALELYEELRNALFNKYQRNRLPWSYIEHVDARIKALRGGPPQG